MSERVSNEQLMEVLFDMKGDIGKLLGKVDAMDEGLAKHIDEDRGMAHDIREIQLRQARHKGALTAITGAGSVAGALIGYVISIWTHK